MRALITGGASGLGAALVRGMLSHGHEIVVVDQDVARLENLPREVLRFSADLADSALLDRLVVTMMPSGPFDLVVMNAGVSASGPFEEIPGGDHQRVVAVNLVAPITLTALLLQRGLVRDGGSLILISSLSHFLGYPGASVYAGTKDGVAVFARSLRKSLRPRRIKVLTVMPGPLDTEHARRYAPPGASGRGRMAPEAAARQIIGRIGTSGVLVPGLGPKLAGVLGRLLPKLAAALMRRSILEKFHAASVQVDQVPAGSARAQETHDETVRRNTADA